MAQTKQSKAGVKAWDKIAKRPTPRQTAQELLDQIQTMLDHARGYIQQVGTKQESAVVIDVDRVHIDSLKHAQAFTDAKYGQVIEIAKKLRKQGKK
jgi:hypothetical protein